MARPAESPASWTGTALAGGAGPFGKIGCQCQPAHARRSDKSTGWQWEACRVTDLARIARLLVAMAWATLLVVCLGLHEARTRLRTAAQPANTTPRRIPAPPPKPQPARHSLFTLGLRLARRWLARTAVPNVRWLLFHLSSLSWNARWRQVQAYLFVFPQTVRL